MWVVHQADDFFVCFGAKPNKGLSSRSRKRGRKGKSERSQRGSWQRNPKRVSWRRETRRGSRERTAEWTSQDELAVQTWQRSVEGGSEEDGQRWVGIPSGFCWSFAKNTLPARVYKMHEKLYKKVSQNYPSCTWSWPKSILFVFFFFFFHSLGCISCGRKEMCNAPVGTHRMNHGPWILLVLRSWCIRGGREGVYHTGGKKV